MVRGFRVVTFSSPPRDRGRSAKKGDDMWRVEYKHAKASSSWTMHDAYGSVVWSV